MLSYDDNYRQNDPNEQNHTCHNTYYYTNRHLITTSTGIHIVPVIVGAIIVGAVIVGAVIVGAVIVSPVIIRAVVSILRSDLVVNNRSTQHRSYWIHLRCKSSCFNWSIQSTLQIFNLSSIGRIYSGLYITYYLDWTTEYSHYLYPWDITNI